MIVRLARRFNVGIMMLYISVVDHARKLKFSIYVHLPSINKIFQYRCTWVILWGVGQFIIFEHGFYISALVRIGMLILRIYVLLECINKIYKYGHAWVI